MRIKCNSEDCHSKDGSCEAVDYQTLGISRMRNQNISTEIIGDLEPGLTPFTSTLLPKVSSYVPKNKLPKQSFADDSQLDMKTFKPASLEFKRNYSQPVIRKNSLDMAGEYSRDFTSDFHGTVRFYSPMDTASIDQVDGNFIGGNVILGKFDKKATKDTLLPSFKDLSNNNNSNNNKNNTGNVNQTDGEDKNRNDPTTAENVPKGKPYALATLDGTIMLVQDEIILWWVITRIAANTLCRISSSYGPILLVSEQYLS